MHARSWIFPMLLLPGLACDGGEQGDGASTEIISRVELSFVPVGGGEPVVAAFTDPDGDGGVSGVAEPIELSAGTEYLLEISLTNELEEPAVDIGAEIRAEAEEHMLFVLGDGVSGPASSSSSALLTQAYSDLESDYGVNEVGEDLPVGLRSTITTTATGSSRLRVVMRHLPPLNGDPQKQADLPQTLAQGGSLPGDVDVDVEFELVVE